MNDHQMLNLIDEIVKEREARIATGTFCCDDCGEEFATSDLVDADDGEYICPICEQEREDF